MGEGEVKMEGGVRKTRMLVVDDVAANRRLIAAVFAPKGFDVVSVESATTAFTALEEGRFDVILLDLRMMGIDGMEALPKIKEIAPGVPVLMLTAHGDVEAAVSAIRLGAYDFLTRPMDNARLVLRVELALERRRLESEVEELRRRLDAAALSRHVTAESEGMKAVLRRIDQVARSSFTVLVQGETGTGKEVVARTLHERSGRQGKPFVAIDCGAIPENLIESELFGYEKGAFSGAERRKEGRLRLAHGGTIFFDEVGNLPVSMQSKILRVVQERKLTPLGGLHEVPIDVRILAATNDVLKDAIAAGRFRQDLFFRLAEFLIVIPPLRERKDDIVPLALRFVEEVNPELRTSVCTISPSAASLLKQYSWPGNVRELRNVIRQAVLQAEGTTIDLLHIAPQLGANLNEPARDRDAASAGKSLREVAERAVAEAEREAIASALRACSGNKSRAARSLKVDFKTLHTKMKRYGLEP
jgi:DNA-binding NtrC family response regulator